MFCFEKSVFLLFKVLKMRFAHFGFFQRRLLNQNKMVSGWFGVVFFKTSHQDEHIKVKNVDARQSQRSGRLPRRASQCPKTRDGRGIVTEPTLDGEVLWGK